MLTIDKITVVFKQRTVCFIPQNKVVASEVKLQHGIFPRYNDLINQPDFLKMQVYLNSPPTS